MYSGDAFGLAQPGLRPRAAIAVLLAGTAFISSGDAWAQEAADKPGALLSQSAKQSDAEGPVVLDPITVTARRRAETAQDAPVSLNVIPLDDIGKGNVDTLEDAAFRSTNTLFNGQGGPLTIRGIGSLGIAGGVDRQPSVGVFLDDVYIARPAGYPIHLTDSERVEVVRGSQATLYGKNTIGGAVNLVSRNPGDSFGVAAEATLGSGRDGDDFFRQLTASFDAPLSGDEGPVKGPVTAALRGYAAWRKADGYIENSDGDRVADTDAISTRLTLKSDLGDSTEAKLSFDYSRDRDDGGLWFAPLPLAFDYKADHDFDPTNEVDIGGISARVDHDFEAFVLTSISAFRGHETETFLDGDFTSTPFIGQAQTESQRQVSQDLRIDSASDDAFNWRGGLFYMHEWFEGDQFFDLVSQPQDLWSRTTFDQDTDTYSAFAEVSYDITPQLELIGGLRYTYERKDTRAETSSPSGTFFFGAPGFAEATESYQNLSPEIAAVYRLDQDNLVFGKISRGFKSGGVSPFIDLNNQANQYDPELTTSYELGAKTSWLDQRLALNASLFYIDWQDQQAVVNTSPFTRVIRNAAAATSKGLELEGAAQVTEDLRVTAYYSYLSAEYADFFDPIRNADFSGNPLPFSPKHTAGVGFRWERPIDYGLTFVSGADFNYRSSYSFTPDNQYRQSPTSLLDVRAGIAAEQWSARVWAKNLLDEEYLQQYFDFAGTDTGVAAPGMTFGISFAAQW